MYFPFQVSIITKATMLYFQLSHLMYSHVFFVVGTKEDYTIHVLPMAIMVFHGAVHLLMTKEYILMIL